MTRPTGKERQKKFQKKIENRPLTIPGSELWKAITNMESNMQALDDTRTISDVARGRDYPNHFQADMSATAASPALGPLKLPVAAAGEGIKTLSGNPSLKREALFNEKTDLKKYLEIMIGKSTNAREEVKYKNILAAVIAEDQADIVKEDIGGDENAIQPRTWQQPFYGDERDELDPEVAAAQTKPSEGDLGMFNQPDQPDQQPLTMKTWENPIYGDERDNKGYDRTDPTQRRDRRLADKLVEGRPLEKFKRDREKGRGTDVDDLFTKNREK